jgi:hypothetical protein
MGTDALCALAIASWTINDCIRKCVQLMPIVIFYLGPERYASKGITPATHRNTCSPFVCMKSQATQDVNWVM